MFIGTRMDIARFAAMLEDERQWRQSSRPPKKPPILAIIIYVIILWVLWWMGN